MARVNKVYRLAKAQFDCPTCKAKAGDPCMVLKPTTTIYGMQTMLHVARLRLAVAKAASEAK